MQEKAKEPEIRFAGFTGAWEQRKLSDIAERITRKNTHLESTLPLTISSSYGLIDQYAYFNNRVASRNTRNYYLIKNGEFAYNKSYSDGFPFGSVKRLDRYAMGVLSTLYIIFSIDYRKVNSDFLVSYYDTKNWHHQVALRAAEGARNHGLLNISADDFFETELKIPMNLDEQKKIGSFFDQLNSFITLHQRKYEKLLNIKKSMLEKMFPKEGEVVPEIRFKGFTGAWEQRKLGELYEKAGSGGTPNASNASFYMGTIPFLGISDIKGRYITKTAKHISEKGLKSSAAWMVPSGAISLAMYASVGKVGITSVELATSQAFYNMVFASSSLRNFIFSRLEKASDNDEWLPLVSTGTQSNLNADKIKNWCISVPNSNEQKLVGEFFKKLDNLLTLHQRKLEMLKNVKQAFLEKMFV